MNPTDFVDSIIPILTKVKPNDEDFDIDMIKDTIAGQMKNDLERHSKRIETAEQNDFNTN